MTSLLATRRRAEVFARLVEGSRRTHDPNLARLVDIVAMLRPAGVSPSEAFRTSLRERLVAAAAEQARVGVPDDLPVPAVRSAVRTPNRLRIAAVAASVVLAGGMVGTAAAARTALPGDFLYPVKRGLEQTEVAVTTNDESRGWRYLGQASNRLTEVSGLTAGKTASDADPKRAELSTETLSEFVRNTNDGGGLLIQAYERDGRTGSLVRLHEFVAAAKPQLEAIGQTLPPAARPVYEEALATLERLDRQVRSLCPVCVSGGSSQADPSGKSEGTGSSADPESGSTQSTRRSSPGGAPGSKPASPDSPDRGGGLLPLPLPWLADSDDGGILNLGLGEPPPHEKLAGSTGLLVPKPTSLPLPLPTESPQPASSSFERQPEKQESEQSGLIPKLDLGWLLPGGIPLPGETQESESPAVEKSPAPDSSDSKQPSPSPSRSEPSRSPSPSPSVSVSPSPSPSVEDGPTGNRILDGLLDLLL